MSHIGLLQTQVDVMFNLWEPYCIKRPYVYLCYILTLYYMKYCLKLCGCVFEAGWRFVSEHDPKLKSNNGVLLDNSNNCTTYPIFVGSVLQLLYS